jgi:hypothetical protein
MEAEMHSGREGQKWRHHPQNGGGFLNVAVPEQQLVNNWEFVQYLTDDPAKRNDYTIRDKCNRAA